MPSLTKSIASHLQTSSRASFFNTSAKRRPSRMCWPWIWDVVRVRTRVYWRRTSRKWWASTSVTVNWRRPEPCRGIRTSRTEELPFPDCSVDLLAAASAAHWFDQSRFLAEASRVLKPGGCVALLGFTDSGTRFHYQGCGERLNHMYEEVKQVLLPFTSNRVAVAEGKLEELYTAIPFPDKERIEGVKVKSSISVRNLVGFIETWSMFQGFKKKDPEAAGELLLTTQKRFLEAMGVMSPDTEMEQEMEYYCILTSKPAQSASRVPAGP
uniref:Zgc:162396 n=1 Tax=Gasterosteus aculeatus aculeatus TaxID=481459 RepID=G3NC09_GASAC